MKDLKKNQNATEIQTRLARTRPSKAALKHAIEKSIKKNDKTLKILAKR